MRMIAFGILSLFLAVAAPPQRKESIASLNDTLEWMTNFSKAHGIKMVNGKILQTSAITSVEGCKVTTKRSYPLASGTKEIKIMTSETDFGGLDPTAISVDITANDSGPTFMVKADRADSAPKIQAKFEMADGSKHTYNLVSEIWNMDSQDSADRFIKALKHAITLCGGKPAPF